jgi:hypothetical protein
MALSVVELARAGGAWRFVVRYGAYPHTCDVDLFRLIDQGISSGLDTIRLILTLEAINVKGTLGFPCTHVQGNPCSILGFPCAIFGL